MQAGRLDEAKRCLIEAGKNPGSPQLDNLGPDMGLAQDLLERGERETVLEYLKLCRKFWKDSRDLLDQWSQAIKAGKTSDLEDNYLWSAQETPNYAVLLPALGTMRRKILWMRPLCNSPDD